MSKRKLHYIASEAAELLGVPVSQIYKMLKNGEIRGYKTHSGKWLINKSQPAFDGIETDEVIVDFQDSVSEQIFLTEVPRKNTAKLSREDEFIKYICDTEHHSVVFDMMSNVTKSLKITSCNLKNFTVVGIDANGKETKVCFADFILDLCKRGVQVNIACMKPLWFFAYMHENLPELEKHPRFELRQDDHMHMKVFIFDDEVAYIGSANLTGAALGLRKKGNRNHEAGILVKGNDIFNSALLHFNSVWNDKSLRRYRYDVFKREMEELKA